jgi:AraC family transcriptional regulator
MATTLRPGHYLGARGIERSGGTFTAALRRATVPPEEVFEHRHEGAHIVLAIDGDYVSDACLTPVAGPMTLVYNPPATLHRDRFATTGGRFMSIDVAPCLTPDEVTGPLMIGSFGARFAAGRMAGLLSAEDIGALDLEDLLLAVLSAVDTVPARSPSPPRWLALAAEAAADVATDSGATIAGIAQEVGVHPVHLARMYRRHFGCTPGEALRRHRVSLAAGLLSRRQGLAEIALDAGFADQSHMTRAFRREYGTTPARYRAAFG